MFIEDDEFDRVGHAPRVKVVSGEGGTCETDSIILEDLKNYQKMAGVKDIMLTEDVNLIINQSIASSNINQSLGFISKMHFPADN